MTEELAVFEAYSLIYEHTYPSNFIVNKGAFANCIGDTVPVADTRDIDTIIGKAVLTNDDKGLIATVTLHDIDKLENESVCLNTYFIYDGEPIGIKNAPVEIAKAKAKAIVLLPAGTIPEHPSVKVKSLDDTLKPCWCGGKRSIRRVTEGAGMDGCYVDWVVDCEGCGARWCRPADNFYGRKPMTKVEVIEEMNKLVSIKEEENG